MTKVKTIVAIGWGEIWRTGYEVETIAIDEKIVSLTWKKSKDIKILFIGTASKDAKTYHHTFKKHYGETLWCEVEILALVWKEPTDSEKEKIRETIVGSDIVYIWWWNTRFMMSVRQQFGVDESLRVAYESWVIMSGISAGSICWFLSWNSDSEFMNETWQLYILEDWLWLLPYLHCPHYVREPQRKESRKQQLKETGQKWIAIDDCAALVVRDWEYEAIQSKEWRHSYLCYREENIYKEVIMTTWGI